MPRTLDAIDRELSTVVAHRKADREKLPTVQALGRSALIKRIQDDTQSIEQLLAERSLVMFDQSIAIL